MFRRALVGAATIALAAAALGSLASGAVPDLTGSWFNVDAPSASPWQFKVSSDRQTLTANWHGDAATGHPNLVGTATATLNSRQPVYVGTLHITEGPSVTTNGTITFTINARDSVTVVYQQDNGPGGTIRFARDPVFAATGNAATVSGQVLVQLPGTKRFVALGQTTDIPVGSVVDARHGRVRIAIASPKGVLSVADFYQGELRFTQPRRLRGIADMRLAGGNFGVCGSGAGTAAATAKPGKSIRRLWGSGSGAFRTTGRFSSATIRGTTWLADDRCNGTLTRVKAGSVTVRDLVRKKSVAVTAPHSYFAAAKH